MNTVENLNLSQINEDNEKINKNGFQISLEIESQTPIQMNNGGVPSKKSHQAEKEISKKKIIIGDQQINQNLNPISDKLIPKNVNNEKQENMIKRNLKDFDKQNKKDVNTSLERQKKETKIREEFGGLLGDLSQSDISELISKLMKIKTGNKRTEQISQIANLIKGSKIPFETELGK